jgi:hypothetical protein
MGFERALEVWISARDAALSIELREESWQQRMQVASTAAAAFPPALIGSVFEFVDGRALDAELWQVIDRRLTPV